MRIWIIILAVAAAAPLQAQTDLRWVNRIGSNGFDGGFAVAVDSTDAIYAGGHFVGTTDFDPGPGVAELTATIEDPFLVRYDSGGGLIWAKHLVGRGTVTDIAVDSNDDVLVVGDFVGSLVVDAMLTLTATNQNRDLFVIKFDSSGNRIWGFALGGDGVDVPQDIALDSTDALILSGTIGVSADLDPGIGVFEVEADIDEDSFVAKYTSNGDFAWGELFEQMTPSGLSQSDSARGLAVDAMDAVFVSGLFEGQVDFGGTVLDAGGTDAYIAKLDSAGVVQWVIATESAGLRTEHFSLGIDQVGNLYAAGMFFGEPDFDPDPVDQALANSNSTLDVYLVSYDATGDFRWVSHLSTPGTFEVFDLLVRADGSSTVAGQFSGTADFDPGPGTELRTASPSDAYFAHYDSSGALISAQHLERISGGSFLTNGIQSLAPAAGGQMVAVGSFRTNVDFDPGPGVVSVLPTAGSPDVFVARYGDPLPPEIFKDGFEQPQIR